ncbi:PREDICTED: putative pentatricopeptide repeat-containing protein At3g23330 [Nelumbo nucifera]|uniref:Pentatricopeptide repeat-containing protein At3g23330 n=2 Tax=Nelumbo nucifera TaxID=4432 RepID=A0A1U8AV19_NELNU|nr:PREDICTED: putative pentatricopeptide repeat-containing protein At3g23330 [Nelumbo nucifera]DAD42848.1 TPA_asm: hypothetical protein HUJ06_001078 [Nelumbo nucifera]
MFPWNGLIKKHVAQRAYHEALQTLTLMHRTDICLLDHFTFPIALKACTNIQAWKQGRQLHGLILRLGFDWDVYTSNALLSMYSGCGQIRVAIQLFDAMPQRNTVSWNSIMAGCIRNDLAHESLSYFSKMIVKPKSSFSVSSLASEEPDTITMCTVLHAHAHLGPTGFPSAKAVHGYIIRRGFQIENEKPAPAAMRTEPFVENALIHTYLEASCLAYAQKVFQEMQPEKRDVVTWTTMISGYLHHKLENLALATFMSMLQQQQQVREGNVYVDAVTLATVIPALGSLRQGKQIHCLAVKNGYDQLNVFVATSLIHVYAEFGTIEYADKLFQRVKDRNVVAWTAIITAYAKHGQGEDSVRLFNEMRRQGVTPNHLTFMGVLTACNHAGLVDQAQECFRCMTQDYGLIPEMHHYAAMVDVLGRAGRLREALEFIKAMPVDASSPVWGSLLASCGYHEDVELAHEVAKILLSMEPDNPANLVLLSNMLAQKERWSDASEVRETMKRLGLRKVPGQSSIPVH